MVASTLIPSETVIKLADVPKLYPFCRRTVTNWVESGLEAWYLGDTPVTTREAISRFTVPIEPKADAPKHERRSKSQHKAADAVGRFLSLK